MYSIVSYIRSVWGHIMKVIKEKTGPRSPVNQNNMLWPTQTSWTNRVWYHLLQENGAPFCKWSYLNTI